MPIALPWIMLRILDCPKNCLYGGILRFGKLHIHVAHIWARLSLENYSSSVTLLSRKKMVILSSYFFSNCWYKLFHTRFPAFCVRCVTGSPFNRHLTNLLGFQICPFLVKKECVRLKALPCVYLTVKQIWFWGLFTLQFSSNIFSRYGFTFF